MMRLAKRHRALLYARGLVLVSVGAFVFLALAVWDIYGKERAAKEKALGMDEERAALQERRDQLSVKLDSLNTQEGLEGEIRETFQVAKEGERMVVIVDPKHGKGAPTPKQTGLWDVVLGWLGLKEE